MPMRTISTGWSASHCRVCRSRAVIKPWPLRPAVAGGFTVDEFTVDETAGTLPARTGSLVRSPALER